MKLEVLMYFEYGNREKEYLASKDPILGRVIEKRGHIYRPVREDIFTSLISHITGQQISSAAHRSVWARLEEKCHPINAENLLALGPEETQKVGLSFRKVEYMMSLAKKVVDKEIDLEALRKMSDIEVTKELIKLKGVGEWTAEMLLIFCLQRPDVISFKDLAIKRGMSALYGYENLDIKTFEKHRQIYSPYATVASLYLWEYSSGKIEI